MTQLGRRYWRVWAAHGTSNLGDGVAYIVLPLLAVSVTDDARLVALVAAARAAPLIVVGPFAGVLADRVDRRSLMARIDVLRAVVAALLAVLVATDTLSIWSLACAAAILGTAEVPFDVSGPAVVRQVVRPDQLEVANSRIQSVQIINNDFAGGPAGGLLFALSPWLAVASIGLLFASASVTIATVPGSFRPDQTGRRSIRAELLDGHRYVWHHPILRHQALAVAALAFAEGTTSAVFVIYATKHLGLGPVGFGLLGSAATVAALGAAYVVPRLVSRLGHGRVMASGVVAMGLGFTIAGLTDQVWIAVIGLALDAAGGPLWNIISFTARQRIVPDAVFGRVSAAYMQLARSTVAVGAVTGGVIAQRYGSDTVFLLTGAIALGVLVTGRSFFADMTAAMAAPQPPSTA